jgi:acyl carrier protein
MNNVDETIFDTMAVILTVDRKKLHDSVSMDTLPAWDSLKHINLIVALESAFGVRFEDETIRELVSFKLIKSHIESLLR